tara:strand:- start:786 stop:1028 length:243 start_codon:yes stop_codon:yes gene_type:complete
MLVIRIIGHSEVELRFTVTINLAMLLVLKPIVMTAWRSRAFKELIVAMLEKIVTRTDNDLDDLAVKHLKDLLLPDTRVEK